MLFYEREEEEGEMGRGRGGRGERGGGRDGDGEGRKRVVWSYYLDNLPKQANKSVSVKTILYIITYIGA